jgi:hypothetical protein
MNLIKMIWKWSNYLTQITVNVLGQYVLTGPIVAVHLFSMRTTWACTAWLPQVAVRAS